MLPLRRRIFFKRIAKLTVAALASFFGVKSGYANRMAEDFADDQVDKIMARLFANQRIIDSDLINLSLPKIAEDGAVVPITISSELEAIDRIYILVEKNPTPLAAEFDLSATAMVYITARIKMAESCNVIVIARQGEHLLKVQQWVNVVQGGCGTG
jgi:sulfur-oxidizing protein SoxY